VYLPEVLVSDVQVPNARIAGHYVPRHQVGCDVRLYAGDVDSQWGMIAEKILM